MGAHKISSEALPDCCDAGPYRVTKIGRVLTLEEERLSRKNAGILSIQQIRTQFYRIIAESDDRLCAVCRAQAGRVIPVVIARQGVNFPPFHPNCRCTAVGESSLNPNQDPGMAERLYWEYVKGSDLTFLEKCELLEALYGDFDEDERKRFAADLVRLYADDPEMVKVIEAFGNGLFNMPPIFGFDWDKKGLPSSEHVTIEFMQAVIEVAKKLKINPDDLMAVIVWESWANPTAVNRASGATGLIQFMPDTAISLGTTTKALSRMSAVEQMEFAYEYLSRNGGNKMTTLSDTYMAVLWPAAVGRPADFVLWERDGRHAGQYRVNSGLDINGDGLITVAEATQRVVDRREQFKR